MQFQQTMQQGMYGAQVGFQSAANRVSLAARGYSQRVNGYGGGGGQQNNFAQMSSANPQFGMQFGTNPGMRNDNQVGFNFPEKQMGNNNQSYTSSDPARCSSKTILGLFVIFLILAAAGAGVGVLFSLNDAKRAQAGLGASGGDNNGTGNDTGGGQRGQFTIDLKFIGSISDDERAAFISAKNRWEQVIIGDLASEAVYEEDDNFCGFEAEDDYVIDDILIVVFIQQIDGPGRILGSAGPCGFGRFFTKKKSHRFDT